MRQTFKETSRLMAMLCIGLTMAIGTASCSDDDYDYESNATDTSTSTDTSSGSGTKVVGYLCYDSFDLKSGEKLVQICSEFKAKGVTELILDLRYNSGGYVFTENALASMLAPQSAVRNKEVYLTEVYNDMLTAYYQQSGQGLVTRFSTTYSYEDEGINYSTADANIGLDKIYALVSSSTASAAEAILVGLAPYLDIDIIGTQTHGKFCTGSVFSIYDVYDDPPVNSEWGLYLMLGTYADKNGDNMARPDGITPDYEVYDDVLDGYQLGDTGETMLNVALQRAGMTDDTATTKALQENPYLGKMHSLQSPKLGIRVADSGSNLLLREDETATTPSEDIQYADYFAYYLMKYYYLWNDEISSSLDQLNYLTCTDPVSTVENIRYSEDRWTTMYEDVSTITSSLAGDSKSNGMVVQYGTFSNTGTYFLVVAYVYADSPAATAGVQRGDVFISYNGADITDDNLVDAYYGYSAATYGKAHAEYDEDGSLVIVDDDTDISLSVSEFYADPVICYTTFEIDD